MSRSGGPGNIPVIGSDIPGSKGGREGNPDGMKEAKEDMPGNPGKGGRELDSGLILKPWER